jgi:AcrR family transcriptional regulator
MDDIVAESGLSKGTLYWYFESKRDLFASLCRQAMAGFRDEWGAIASDESLSATEKLVHGLIFYRSHLAEFVPLFGLVMEAWALSRQDREEGLISRETYGPYLDALQRIIDEGVVSGEFSVTAARSMAFAVMGLLDGLTLAMSAAVCEHNWPQVADAATALVLRGLGVIDAEGA